MIMPMVYTMTSWIGAHIYTLHYAYADGIHDNEFDKGRIYICIHYVNILTPMVYTMTSSIAAHICTLHYAYADDIHNDEFDRCAYIHTTPCAHR
jgi:hypothetical protein